MNKWIKRCPELDAACDAYSQQNKKLSAQLCTEIINARPDHAEALMMRAFCTEESDPEQAERDYRAAAELLEHELDAYERLELADTAQDLNFSSSLCAELFERAGEALIYEEGAPADIAESFNRAGICHFRNGGEPETEVELFERALLFLPDGDTEGKELVLRALIQSNLAEALVRTGEDDRAAELYARSAVMFQKRIEKGDRAALTHYMVCKKGLADITRAAEENIMAHGHLSDAIELMRGQSGELNETLKYQLAMLYNSRGTLRFQMGDYEGEVKDCTAAIELCRDMPDDITFLSTIYSNRGEAYQQMENYKLAEQDIITSICRLEQLSDNRAACCMLAVRRFTLSRVYESTDRPEDEAQQLMLALDAFDRARTAHGPDPEFGDEELYDIEALCCYHLAELLCHGKDRDYTQALSLLRRAVEIYEGKLNRSAVSVESFAHLSTLHDFAGEIFEMFDDHSAAENEYRMAEHYHEEFTRRMFMQMLEDGVSDLECISDNGAQDETDIDEDSDIWEDTAESPPQG